MIYPDIIYIFDFDDTLMWSPKWYFDSKTNQAGKLIEIGSSPGLKKAVEFLSHIDKQLPEKFQGIELWARKFDRPKLGKPEALAFALFDKNQQPISIEEMKKFFSSEELSDAFIDVSGKMIDLPAVTDDYLFYRQPGTVGSMGPNWEIFNLYLKHNDNAIILTAREEFPGIKKRILELIKEYGAKPPIALFAKPGGAEGGGRFKAEVILDILSSPNIKEVYYYDDNLNYVSTVDKSLKDYDSEHRTGLRKKIKIITVDISDKPKIAMKILERSSLLSKYV